MQFSLKRSHSISLLIATQVVIGFEETEYSVPETATSQVVCADVKSGSIAGRDIQLRYAVSDAGMHSMHILAMDGNSCATLNIITLPQLNQQFRMAQLCLLMMPPYSA